MKIGIPKETKSGETRISASPDTVKRLIKKGLEVVVEKGAGETSTFSDGDFQEAGAQMVDRAQALGAQVVFKIHPPTADEVKSMKGGALLLSLLDTWNDQKHLESLAAQGVNAVAMERVPRTSRAQSMDVLSSQANIAGYRAVIEAATHYRRFFPLMMTSAGSAKPARVAILGAGVAGLQAIATARRLGTNVEAYDVRPEVKEQILSLGAKFIEINTGETGSGEGGYARELSDVAKQKQQAALTEKLKTFDIIISTANVPGRKAPVLITEEALKGMRTGSVIIDMAAPSGGNCAATTADQVVEKHGVKIVGVTNLPGLVPADASSFYGRNLVELLSLFLKVEEGNKTPTLHYPMDDDIVAAALLVQDGKIRIGGK